MISNHTFWIGFLIGAFFVGVACMAIGLFAVLDGRKKKLTGGDGTYTIPSDAKYVSVHLTGGAGGGNGGESKIIVEEYLHGGNGGIAVGTMTEYYGDETSVSRPKPPLMLDL